MNKRDSEFDTNVMVSFIIGVILFIIGVIKVVSYVHEQRAQAPKVDCIIQPHRNQ